MVRYISCYEVILHGFAFLINAGVMNYVHANVLAPFQHVIPSCAAYTRIFTFLKSLSFMLYVLDTFMGSL